MRMTVEGKFPWPELMEHGANSARVWAPSPTGPIHAANVCTHDTKMRCGQTYWPNDNSYNCVISQEQQTQNYYFAPSTVPLLLPSQELRLFRPLNIQPGTNHCTQNDKIISYYFFFYLLF